MSFQKANLFVGQQSVSAGNRVPVELSGELNSFIRDVQRGNVEGSRVFRQWAGMSLATGLTRSFWALGNTGNQPLGVATATLEIVSSSALDTAAGTGARTVYVEGLDSAGAVKSTVATMNGVTAVSLGVGWLGTPNFVEVRTAGSTFSNQGIIDVQVASAGAVQARMLNPQGVANQLRYRVPAGKVAYILQESFGSMGDTVAQTFVTGTSTTVLPLLSTGLLGFEIKTGATVADLVYAQRTRFFAYRGKQETRDYGFSVMLPELSIYAPSVQNLTANTIEFIGDVLILEEDMPE